MTVTLGRVRDLAVERGSYASHPCLAGTATGEVLMLYARSGEPVGDMIHPPNDRRFVNVLVRSGDRGLTWRDGRVVPSDSWTGVECSGLTVLTGGAILINQFRFAWLPVADAREQWAQGELQPYIRDPADGRWRLVRSAGDWSIHDQPFARLDDGSYVHRSEDGGQTWTTTRLEIEPYQGAFSPKGGVELADGEVVLALGSHEHDPLATSMIVRSWDGGRTWTRPKSVAVEKGLVFSEPTIVAVDEARLLVFSREETTGFVFKSESNDRGKSWGSPAPLPMWGYPCHAIRLRDGRVLIVYGHRRRPYGIRGCLSDDGGRSWGDEFIISGDIVDRRLGLNLGYPSAVEVDAGNVLVAWYAEDESGIVGIRGSLAVIAATNGRTSVHHVEDLWTQRLPDHV